MKIQSQQGASAIEFALIAPLLFTLTLGMIEFGLLLFDKAIITNAVREGARAAIVFNTDGTNYTPIAASEVNTIVRNYANPYLINLGSASAQDLETGDIQVEYETGVPVSGEDVTITANYTYDFLVLPNFSKLLGGDMDGTVTLESQAVMRME